MTVTTTTTTAELPSAPRSRLARHGMLVTAASVGSGLLSYVGTVALAHLLPPARYTEFVAVQSLLLFAGTALSATVAWSTVAALTEKNAASQRLSVAFAVLVASIGGSVGAVLIGGLATSIAGAGAGISAGVAVLLIAFAGLGYGRAQGHGFFLSFAVFRLSEAALRTVGAIVLAILGAGVFGAVLGFPVAALVVLAASLGLVSLRKRSWSVVGRNWRVVADSARWRALGSLAGSQVGLGALASLDLVLVTFVVGRSAATADLQVAMTLGRVPLFAAMALAQVLFPALRRGANVLPLLTAWVSAAGLVFAVVSTTPVAVLGVVVPRADHVATLLPATAAIGVGQGGAVLLCAVLQARGRYRLGLGSVIGAVLLAAAGQMVGQSSAGVGGAAVGEAVGIALGVVLGVVLARSTRVTGSLVVRLVPWLLFAGALTLARSVVPVWLALVAGVTAYTIRTVAQRKQPAVSSSGRRRVLHLGFEDPRMPGAGGGSLRTQEINRRLAAQFDITVFTSRFPGCVDGMYDGVRYRHIGIGRGRGHFSRMIGYGLVVAFAARRYLRQNQVDLVVEDFFAPVSSLGAPRWTGHPTIAVVQWLNAKEKSRQYHLPFFLVERFGVAAHHTFIAVSAGIRARLLAMNPQAKVIRIGNGVDPLAFEEPLCTGEDIVFVGRIERDQKGTDLLARAFARHAGRIRGDLVIIGDGPDWAQLKDSVAELGIAHRVRFAGRVDGEAKFAAMARAAVVAVPSRFETFGIVAAEALASGTAVVAFDIDCLREIVPAEHGTLVPAFDIHAFGAALAAYASDPGDLRAAERRRDYARQFSWDDRAAEQAQVYRECLVVS